MPSRVRPALLAIALLTALAPAAGAAPSCKNVVRRAGLWYRAPAPKFPAVPGATETSQVVSWVQPDPNRRGRLFVSNGSSVLRSEDYGCTWRAVYVSPLGATEHEAGPASGTVPGTSVVSLVTARDNRAYLLVATLAFVPRLQVYASSDGGATFAEGGPVPGGVVNRESLATAWSDPSRVYLVIRPGLFGTAPVLLRSRDGGGSWQVVPPAPAVATGTGTITGVAVEPGNPDAVYVWGGGTPVFRSANAGDAFTAVSGSATTVAGSTVALTRPRSGPSDVVFTDRKDLYAISGPKSGALATGLGGSSVTAGASLKQLLVATGSNGAMSGIYRWSPKGNKLVAVTPAGGARDVATDGTTFYAVSNDAVYRYAGPLT